MRLSTNFHMHRVQAWWRYTCKPRPTQLGVCCASLPLQPGNSASAGMICSSRHANGTHCAAGRAHYAQAGGGDLRRQSLQQLLGSSELLLSQGSPRPVVDQAHHGPQLLEVPLGQPALPAPTSTWVAAACSLLGMLSGPTFTDQAVGAGLQPD